MKLQAKVFKNEGSSKRVGNASVTFDGKFVIKGFGVIEGSNGLFVAMPSKKNQKDEWVDQAFPLNKEFREELTKVILDEYNKLEEDDIDVF